MNIISYILFSIGVIIALFYFLKIVRIAYHESVLLGIGSLLIPIVCLVFIAVHWADTKPDFIKFLASIPFLVLSAIVHQATT